jgi:plasmid stability protein
MAQLIVRNLDEAVKDGLRHLARQHGHSMEEEARVILSAATTNAATMPPKKLGTFIAELVKKNGGLKEPIPELRGEFIRPVKF